MKNKKIKLNIGCGGSLVPGFINVDAFFTYAALRQIYRDRGEEFPTDAEFVQADIADMPFNDNYADYIELVDMIEHLPVRQLSQAFTELYRVLKPGGEVCIVTTDFDGVARQWLKVSEEFNKTLTDGKDISGLFDSSHRLDKDHLWSEIMKKKVNLVMSIIYGNQFHQGEFHQSLFTPYIMHVYLRQAGFEHDKINIIVHKEGTVIPELQAFEPERFLKDEEGNIIGTTVLTNDLIVARATK